MDMSWLHLSGVAKPVTLLNSVGIYRRVPENRGQAGLNISSIALLTTELDARGLLARGWR